MISNEAQEKIIALDEALFGKQPRNFLDSFSAPFDVSRPNIHDTKTDFLEELGAVENILTYCEGILEELGAPTVDIESMRFRLSVAIDVTGLQERPLSLVTTHTDLILRNVVDTGLQRNFRNVVELAAGAYRERLQELKRQEKLFWSVANRPPNYYARTIALRFAKRFGRILKRKPTFGTTSDSNHPSTDYGRALEEIFEILQINASVRRAAEWAISQLEDDDWQPPPQNALRILLGNEVTNTSE